VGVGTGSFSDKGNDSHKLEIILMYFGT
jgi:hypothetical protein